MANTTVTKSPDTPTWSRLGLGTGTLASLGRAIPKRDAENLIATMIDERIRVIDTADAYGSGDCEILLGKLMKSRRDSFTIVTKAGYRHSNLPGPLRPLNQPLKKLINLSGPNQNFEPSYLEACLQASLRRLGTDHVDAFLLHNPPLGIVSSDEIHDLFERLKAAGKVRLCGVSAASHEVLHAAAASDCYEVLQTPSSPNTAAALAPLWEACSAKSIHIIGNHVFDPSGLAADGMNHEVLMRAASALLPDGATILCGTKNSSHLRQSNGWVHEPLAKEDALNLAACLCGRTPKS